MLQAFQTYLDCVIEKLKMVRANSEPIQEAAKMIYKGITSGGYLHVFGTGHSHMFAEEVFYRAGGLARVNPIFDDRLMLHVSASQSTIYERQSELAKQLFQAHPITDKDVVVIASNSGRNAATVEMALLAKRAGAKVIALTSVQHSSSQASRHASGKRLFEICDIVLDNYGEVGDACVAVKGGKVAATSTVVGCAILEAIVAQVVAMSDKTGVVLETFSSSNVDGGDAINQKLIDKYKQSIPSL